MNALMAADFEIRQLHARTIDAVWRQDCAAFAGCYAEGGEWKVAGFHVKGRANIEAQLNIFIKPIERVLMTFGDPIVDIANDGEVSSRTFVTETNRYRDGHTASTIGVYYERFIQEDGLWRYAWRHWSLHYLGPPDFTGTLYPVKDYGPPPNLPAPDDPTTVRPELKDEIEPPRN